MNPFIPRGALTIAVLILGVVNVVLALVDHNWPAVCGWSVAILGWYNASGWESMYRDSNPRRRNWVRL